MIGQRIGNLAAQVIDEVLQIGVEQIADHCHAAAHPLS